MGPALGVRGSLLNEGWTCPLAVALGWARANQTKGRCMCKGPQE